MVKKNGRKKRVEVLFAKRLVNMFIKLLKNWGYLIIGFSYSGYLLIKLIHRIILFLYYKLPKIVQVGIVYTMIILAFLQFNTLMNNFESGTKFIVDEVRICNKLCGND